MRVAVIGNIGHGQVDMRRYMPEETSSILYIRGQYVGECANEYADEHNLAKLGYPNFGDALGTPRETEVFNALIDGAECLIVLYHTPSITLDAAQQYAKRQGMPVQSYWVKAS